VKRSEINLLQEEAKRFLAERRFPLPPWAFRRPAGWRGLGPEIDEIRENALGWDVTDFGSRDFARRGLLLFTLRNGDPNRDRKPYAEKIMIVGLMQETPMHFHRRKMEDIINRGGGPLMPSNSRWTGSGGGFRRGPGSTWRAAKASAWSPSSTTVSGRRGKRPS
jgi:D-lyxose ketol-isomerase